MKEMLKKVFMALKWWGNVLIISIAEIIIMVYSHVNPIIIIVTLVATMILLTIGSFSLHERYVSDVCDYDSLLDDYRLIKVSGGVIEVGKTFWEKNKRIIFPIKFPFIFTTKDERHFDLTTNANFVVEKVEVTLPIRFIVYLHPDDKYHKTFGFDPNEIYKRMSLNDWTSVEKYMGNSIACTLQTFTNLSDFIAAYIKGEYEGDIYSKINTILTATEIPPPFTAIKKIQVKQVYQIELELL